jgi:hypothetical protein
MFLVLNADFYNCKCRPISRGGPNLLPCQLWDFMVDEVALGQDFLGVLRFSPVIIIPPWLSMLIYHQGNKHNRPAGDRGSETWSHPIDMNNKNNKCILHILRMPVFFMLCT